MTLDEVIKALQQASEDTGWGDKDVDIHLRYNDEFLRVFLAPSGPSEIAVVREESVEYRNTESVVKCWRSSEH